MIRTADMWLSTRKGHISEIFVCCMTGDKPILSYILWVVRIPPTLPLESYWNVTKQDDVEFKDWIEKKNFKLVGERHIICTWRTGDRVIIRIACVAGGMVTRGVLSWRRSREGEFQFDLLPNLLRLRRSAAKKQQHSPADAASRAG